MAAVSINSEQITSIANSLKSKGEQILNQYRGDCASALQMSNQCLQLSGLDTDQIFKSMENVYTKLNDRVAGLADFLINTIAAEYDVLSQSITNSFNNDFANEFGALVGVAGGGGASGATFRTPINPDERGQIDPIVHGDFKKTSVIDKSEGVENYLGDNTFSPVSDTMKSSFIAKDLNKQVELSTITDNNRSIAQTINSDDNFISNNVITDKRIALQRPSADATIQPVKMFNPINRGGSTATFPGFVSEPNTMTNQLLSRKGGIGIDAIALE